MSIYRGDGGSGDANNNVTINEVENLRSEAVQARDDAQTAETNAENAQAYSEEWANKAEDSLVSTDAGGDGVDDYSALHWSFKAEDEKIAAEAAKTAAETAQDNAELAETNAELAQAGAESAEDGAIAAAATVPAYETLASNALQYVRLNASEDTMEFRTALQTTQDLSVEVGVDTQPYSVTTADYSDTTANFTGSLQNGGSPVVVDSDIGVNVQAYDPDIPSEKATNSQATAGTDDTAYMTALKTKQSGATFFEKHIAGLVPSQDVDVDHDITISEGVAVASNASTVLRLDSPITKQIDAAWVAGTDAGGLFSGTVAADTTYHLFIIEKDSDGSIDAGFDTSLTAANIPTGYTNYRRVASCLTNSSSNVIGFVATEVMGGGLNFTYKSRIEDVNNDSPGTFGNVAVMSAPSDVKMMGKFSLFLANTSSNAYVLVSERDSSDVAASITNHDLRVVSTATQQNNTNIERMTDTSSSIRYRSDTATVSFLSIQTLGFIDFRRD